MIDEIETVTRQKLLIILKRVFSNLISNSIKFTDTGSIHFGYRVTENNTITGFVTVAGIGITPENHVIIFENFRQVE